jgi:hypothetical protein
LEGVDSAGVVIGAFCTANCTFTSLDGCGFDDASGGVRQAACLQSQVSTGEPGDIGFCLPLCDTTPDCAQANDGWVCEPFTDARLVAQLGRQGSCLPAAIASPGAPDAGPG